MFTPFAAIPLLFFVVWLAVIVYLILLGTRLVNAVEQIARSMPPRRDQP